MRIVVLLVLLSVTAVGQAPPPPPPPGAIGGVIGRGGAGAARPAPPLRPEDACLLDGKIVNAVTGESLRKAGITLSPVVTGPITAPPMSFTTTTDAEGKFAMKDLPPGQYRLTVQRTGFVTTQYGSKGVGRPGTILTFTAGQRMRNLEVKMQPHAVITGRVTDEDGEPLANTQVTSMKYRFQTGRRALSTIASGTTNDLGEYRISGVEPGRYYVSAIFRGLQNPTNSQDRSANPKLDETYPQSFYPSGTDPRSAIMVDAVAGTTVQGINLSLTKVPTTKITGKVINQTGARAGTQMVYLFPANSAALGLLNIRPAVVNPDGSFELRGVIPGSYALTAMFSDGNRPLTGRLAVEVTTSNIENAVVTISNGYEVAGNLKVDGTGGVTVDVTSLRVGLRQLEQGGLEVSAPIATPIKEDGAFSISNILPERYMLTVLPLQPGTYVKSIRMGEEDVLDSPLDFTRGPGAPLRVVLSTNAPTVTGLVTSSSGNPMPGATVVLIPELAKRREQQQWYKTTTSDQAGRYSLSGIDPGEYKVLAWEDIDTGAWLDPDFIQPLESKAKSLELKEGARESLDLKIIPAE